MSSNSTFQTYQTSNGNLSSSVEGLRELSDRKRHGRKISRMRHNVEGISSCSLFLQSQTGQECTNGVVNRLLMVISWLSKVPVERRTVSGAHADTDEVHGRKF